MLADRTYKDSSTTALTGFRAQVGAISPVVCASIDVWDRQGEGEEREKRNLHGGFLTCRLGQRYVIVVDG